VKKFYGKKLLKNVLEAYKEFIRRRFAKYQLYSSIENHRVKMQRKKIVDKLRNFTIQGNEIK